MSDSPQYDRLLFLNLSNPDTVVLSGQGSPEGAVTANPGDLYLRIDGGVGESLYSKESGAGDTGWVAATEGVTNPLVLEDGDATTSVVGATSGVLVSDGAASGGTEEVTLSTSGIVAGVVDAPATGTSRVVVNGQGSMAIGYSKSGAGETSEIETQAVGAVAAGYASGGGNIVASGKGAMARGWNKGTGAIGAEGPGSFASGYASEAASLRAEGAIAWGTAVFGWARFGDIRGATAGQLVHGFAAGGGAAYPGDILATNTAEGSFVGGLTSGTGAATIICREGGSILHGQCDSSGTGVAELEIPTLAHASLATGIATASNGGAAKISTYSPGSSAIGAATDSNLLASGKGSQARGFASGGDISTTGNGSTAIGYAAGGDISAVGIGSTASGTTLSSAANVAISANGDGAVVFGVARNTATGNITTSNYAYNAVCFGFSHGGDGDITAYGSGSLCRGTLRDGYGDISSYGPGSFCVGYIRNGVSGDQVRSYGTASAAIGYIGNGTGYGVITSASRGSMAFGSMNSVPAAGALIRTYGDGALAFGNFCSSAGTIEAGRGGMACGNVSGATGGTIKAYGFGSFARGGVSNGGYLQAYGTASSAQGYAYGSTSVIQAYSNGSRASGHAKVLGTGNVLISAYSEGAIAHGWARQSSTFGSDIRATGRGSFAGGKSQALAADTDIIASGEGAVAFGFAHDGNLLASGDGAQVFGYADDQLIGAYGNGAFASGSATGGDIQATVAGAFAFGSAVSSDIVASAANAMQLGEGTNSTADSLQIGAGSLIKANGQSRSDPQTATLGAAATTLAITSDVVVLTGDVGANTLGTITGGLAGEEVTIIFTDSLVTITDTGTGTADTVNMSAAFTSSANDVLKIVNDGTSWFEVSRSVN